MSTRKCDEGYIKLTHMAQTPWGMYINIDTKYNRTERYHKQRESEIGDITYKSMKHYTDKIISSYGLSHNKIK